MLHGSRYVMRVTSNASALYIPGIIERASVCKTNLGPSRFCYASRGPAPGCLIMFNYFLYDARLAASKNGCA